jgi:hypothetical protein
VSMDLLALLNLPESFPFVVAIFLLLGIGALELVGLLLGMSLSGVIDDALPEFSVEADGTQGLQKAFSWLGFGRVPALVILVIALAVFSIFGVSLQAAITSLFGSPLPAILAGLGAAAATVPVSGLLVKAVARIVPKETSSAINIESLSGQTATIVIGTAKKGLPSQAKVRDLYGQAHYVLVEPEKDESFSQGDQVVLVQLNGHIFSCRRVDASADTIYPLQ